MAKLSGVCGSARGLLTLVIKTGEARNARLGVLAFLKGTLDFAGSSESSLTSLARFTLL